MYDLAFNIISNWEHPVLVVANRGQINEQFHHQHKINKGFLAKCYLKQDPWFEDPTCLTSLSNNLTLDSGESDHPTFTDASDPRILAARTKTSKYKSDNPSFNTAMRGPFQAEFWQAMQIELNTLENEFHCWELVQLPGNSKENNILPSTWAFKIKRNPDGQVKKFKAQFCARGNHQKEGINFFETWALVVQWSKVRIVMVLAAKLDLISVQCDITAAFVHARVPDIETIYVHQPRGFKQGNSNDVLCLKRPYTDSNKPHVTSSNILLGDLFNKGLHLQNMILGSS